MMPRRLSSCTIGSMHRALRSPSALTGAFLNFWAGIGCITSVRFLIALGETCEEGYAYGLALMAI